MFRYLTRKIGFESVMRIRCTRGMSLHTFHGHFFVRSTDLLSLPNVNPDSGFGMQVCWIQKILVNPFIFVFLYQVSIDEDLKDCREVSFQAALLYTSSKVCNARSVLAKTLFRLISGREEDQGSHPLRAHHGQPPGSDPERWPAVHRGAARQDGSGPDPEHQPGRRQGGFYKCVCRHDREVGY